MESYPARSQETTENSGSARNQRMLKTHKTGQVEDDSE